MLFSKDRASVIIQSGMLLIIILGQQVQTWIVLYKLGCSVVLLIKGSVHLSGEKSRRKKAGISVGMLLAASKGNLTQLASTII